MLRYRPVQFRLGQLSKLLTASGITGDLAKQIVDAADPATRRIIKAERNRLAEALIGGTVFAGISALAYVNTRYLVPDSSTKAKAVGYSAAALAMAVGAWWTLDHMSDSTVKPITEQGGVVADVAAQAARDIVNEAEPRIRRIVEEEKARAVQAAQAGIPLAIGSLAAFLLTTFLVDDKNKTMKAVGYSGSALLLGAGAYVALDKEREVMTT